MLVGAVPKPNGDIRIKWEIVSEQKTKEPAAADDDEQTGAGGSVCPLCTTPVPASYVKDCGVAGRIGESLAAVVVDAGPSKLYLPPETAQLPADNDEIANRLLTSAAAAGVDVPTEELQGKLCDQLPSYGYGKFRDLFTKRQMAVLVTLARHVRSAHRQMVEGGMDRGRADAITTYLGMAFGRLLNSFTTFCRWQGQDQKTIAAIGDRQALKMVYDFSEINPFAETAGCLPFAIDNEVFCIKQLASVGTECIVVRGNAEDLPYENETFDVVVTDRPYYGSIFYADLSKFFYVWLRRILGDLYPEHFVLSGPPKRREAVAQPSEHGGSPEKAEEHYCEVMKNALTEAGRVLKPGAPLVCVYAHKTVEGWASLINALVPAGMMVTEAWPVQTEARGRVNALEAAALSDSIFFVARRRQSSATGQYETDVQPTLETIARERVATLWADGKGIGGADLLMAAVGAGLRAYTQFAKVEYANGDPVSPERYLAEVEGVVLDTMLEQVFGLSKAKVSAVDSITRFYVLWRFVYRESSIPSGDAIVFCYPQNIKIDGPGGISGPSPALVEKSGATYRVRTFEERGDVQDLGLARDGAPAPLIDSLHRTLWLMKRQPSALAPFLRDAKPNLDEMRLVAQALARPALKGSELDGLSPTRELAALWELTANWHSVVEDASITPLKRVELRTGQKPLDFGQGEE
jgi:putative DNA methylase